MVRIGEKKTPPTLIYLELLYYIGSLFDYLAGINSDISCESVCVGEGVS